jgi:hypothetical protein
VPQLDPRYVRLERAVGWIVIAVLAAAGGGGLAIAGALGASGAWLAAIGGAYAVVLAVLAWLAHAWPAYEHRYAAYEVDDDAIEVRGGVLWRHVRKVPRSRVQHTDVAQGPLERRFGLATLVIHTAGTEHAQVTVEGLAHEAALAIRDRLLPREQADAV